VRELIERKRLAVAGPVASRRQRVARFRAIRDLNERLSQELESEQQRNDEALRACEAQLRENLLARSREWSYPLHSRKRWELALTQIGILETNLEKKRSSGDLVEAKPSRPL
jgi:hypothetical protein